MTLASSVKLMDNMSEGFTRIINAVNLTVSALRKMSNENVKIQGLEDIQNELAMAGAEISLFKDGLAKARQGADNLKNKVTGVGQATENAANQQNKWNNNISKGTNNMNGLFNKLKAAIGTYALINGGKKLLGLSDETMTIDARLNLITDTKQQKASLKNAIYQSAQDARAPLNEFANQIAQLGILVGDKFAGNKEIIKFNNLLAKSFKITGASAQATSAAMYQLNQALVSGRLQGDEFRIIRETAPMLVKGIADAMHVSEGELKKLGAEGKITADVIKQAVFGMESDINKSFAQLPLTWADVWNRMKNFAIKTLDPLLRMINRIANSKKFQELAAGVANTFEIVAGVITKAFGIALKVIGWVYDKWDVLKYPIGIIIALIGAYVLAQGAANVAVGLYNIAMGFKAAADMAASGASFMATMAQHGLNAAVYAFPGTWIVAAVIAVVIVLGVLIIAAIAVTIAFIKMKTGTLTVTGTIVGSFRWMAAQIWNVIADIINGFVMLVNKAITMFNQLSRNAAKGLSNFANIFIDAFNQIMKKADEFANKLLQKMQPFGPLLSTVGIKLPGQTGGAFQFDKINLNAPQIGLINNGKNEILRKKDPNFEYTAGAAWGNRHEKNALDSLKGVKDKVWDELGLGDLGRLGKDPGQDGGLGDVGKNTGKTADNTGKMADSLDDTEEEMKYLRELAEQEHINQFTTAEIKVEMNNENNISSGTDIDDMIRKLTEKLENAMHRTASGVYSR